MLQDIIHILLTKITLSTTIDLNQYFILNHQYITLRFKYVKIFEIAKADNAASCNLYSLKCLQGHRNICAKWQ